MAIFGFLILILIGCYLCWWSFTMLLVSHAFGSMEKLAIIPGLIGGFILYYSITHAPFVISMSVS
jgi:UDP-N-acetylenolpyruvoylglucosamine reductase